MFPDIAVKLNITTCYQVTELVYRHVSHSEVNRMSHNPNISTLGLKLSEGCQSVYIISNGGTGVTLQSQTVY